MDAVEKVYTHVRLIGSSVDWSSVDWAVTDSVSSFLSVGKASACNVMVNNQDRFEKVFENLSHSCQIDDESFSLVEEFVCSIYTKDGLIKKVNECRFALHNKRSPI